MKNSIFRFLIILILISAVTVQTACGSFASPFSSGKADPSAQSASASRDSSASEDPADSAPAELNSTASSLESTDTGLQESSGSPLQESSADMQADSGDVPEPADSGASDDLPSASGGIEFFPEEYSLSDASSSGDFEISPESDYIKTDILGNQFVNIPEGTPVLVYDGDPSQTLLEMADAVAARHEIVCVKNQYLWYDTTDFYAMPYSSFWLADISGTGVIGQTDRKSEQTSWHFYRFTYYDLSEEELARMKAEIDAAASGIISLIPEGADDWTSARIVHDELCRLITYDDTAEAPHCHDTYGALVNHLAVCTGYACAFSHIMSLLGNYSPLSYSDEHAWNYVAVPSDQVYIDVTWDDPDLTDAYGDPYIDYSYFFLTRSEVESIDSHSISSFDPISEPPEPEPYNYYAHEGYMLYEYNWDVILDMLYRQYVTGTNLLTIRFAYAEDYERALLWPENDGAELQEFLSALGYYGTYYYWYNDVMHTVSFGLYAAEQ